MAQVIAGIYEIQEKIGAGGGGIVYLGRHMRLDKTVVLKADKRTLSVGAEKLRREVDLLKNLSQTYIPQVYDFVQENGVVYTVMDYIDGESLDKLLGRGQIPTQAEVVKWACQLLEALCYLHSRPPHGILHGDIKPANIMLRPGGDICLIDFNIALALGEDGAVKVGFSRGYASPEHYGADYIKSNKPAAVGPVTQTKTQNNLADDKTEVADDDKTEVLDDDKTVVEESSRPVATPSMMRTPSVMGSTTGGTRGILLDVRSDIYSLGATLYHLISGVRPNQDALQVKPLGTDVCSAAVSAILQKAMAPQPEKRYQTAEEMLDAFLKLYKTDKRTIRHKRRMMSTVALLSATFLAGGACTFVGLKQLEQKQEALALAEYSANALDKGDVTTAVKQAMQAIPENGNLLQAPVTPQAQKALTDALGVYRLADGFGAKDSITLPATPFDMTLSPDGTKMAVVYAYEVAVYDLASSEVIVSLPIQNSALADVVFADDSTMIYAGDTGVTAYDLEKQAVLWTGDVATNIAISADKKVVACVNRDEAQANVYNTSDGTKMNTCSFNGLHMTVAVNDIFADPQDDIFALNADGTMLAVSFDNGALTVFDLQNSDNDLLLLEESDYQYFEGGFHENYFAYVTGKSGESILRIVDTKEAVYAAEYDARERLHLKADASGIYLAEDGLLVEFDMQTGQEKELAYTEGANIRTFTIGDKYALVATDDNRFAFYDSGAKLSSSVSGETASDFLLVKDSYAVVGNRNEPTVRVLQLQQHSDADVFAYDPYYQHDEARISQDGKTAMLFGYQDFRIYNETGEQVAQVDLPDAEAIYDQQFRKGNEDSWLEVIWYDGTVRCYSAKDGALISEEKKEAPNKDLEEEFVIDGYRIVSKLHEAPAVYETDTDKQVATLEEESYLTYVTQFGEYIVTEYISTTGERYGILLNNRFEQLAYLPNLCDISGDMLVFDYKTGNLRQCRLYSLQELTALGETY